MERAIGVGILQGEIRDDGTEALGRGAVVVTGNERAARSVRRAYDDLLRAAGRDRWEPATVMSWSAWTTSLWRQMLVEGRTRALLLNTFQEHAVWKEILAGDTTADSLRGVDGLADMAAEAWKRMCAYAASPQVRGGRVRGVSALLDEQNGNSDTAAFARWARVFEQRCNDERLLTMAGLDAVLSEEVRTRNLRLEASELLLVGHDRMMPAQERLLDALRSSGIVISHAGGRVHHERRLLTAATDEAEELRACARWAAAWLDREPRMQIAVIVPDLGTERAGIERVFREILAPDLESIAANEGTAPFEFSLGRTLAEAPMVAVALELLRWAGGALPLDRVSALLVSDYFAGRNSPGQVSGAHAGEREARAAFDAYKLRREGMLRPEITIARMVRQVAGSKQAVKLPGLLTALRRLQRTAGEFGERAQSYGEWAEALRDLLAGAGWGPAAAETSEEFQLRERWESALDVMATLDFRGAAVEYADALRAIERIAQTSTFAPESRSAPVQVMGPLEAAGSEFNAVWFLRAGELAWPPVTGSLPLVGWGLQRDLGMPGTDVALDLDAATRITERIVASGREVVVSYARISGEARQRASPIVRGMDLEEIAIGDLAGGPPVREAVAIERVEDLGPIRPLPDGVVSGGVRILELQAACGFRAFAEQRLGSIDLEGTALGLSAKESGIAVHTALESFWTEVKSQAALIAMSVEERAGALTRAIDEGLKTAEQTSNGVWEVAYLQTQRERLRRLLERWLEVETKRPAFTVVKQEAREEVHLGPLRFQLRVDRVDLVDESRVLIDYKTGAAAPAAWMGERPDAPQVPLYAILAAREMAEAYGSEDLWRGSGGAELGAVAFGNVRAGEGARMHGFASREGLLPGRLAMMEGRTFEEQVDRWREVLERLAEEFAGGDARVRPKNYPSTCLRCGQRMLCRLDASIVEEIETEDETGDGDGG